MSVPRLSWYADDFTGATDALDALTRAGLRAALFIDPPTLATLAALGDLDAVGVAGRTRSLAEDELREEVARGLTALRAVGAPLCHYKVCSTFDSSPQFGSIGAAIEEGLKVLGGDWVPLLVGVPALGRWCVFGNLFARIGGTGPVERLDRHPVADHPVTPMHEADLLRHLAAQTNLAGGLVVSHLAGAGAGTVEEQLARLRDSGTRVCLLDVADGEDLAAAGAAIAAAGAEGRVCLVVGSSGVEYALAEHWRGEGEAMPRELEEATPVDCLVVLSGSCSAVTGSQIEWALANGFDEIALDTPGLFGPGAAELILAAGERLDAALDRGGSVVVHTAIGPADPRIEAVRGIAGSAGLEAVLGPALAQLGERAAARGDVSRLMFTGGDTSSAGARGLGIESVEVVAPVLAGAPLCRSHAPGRVADGLEILFKGGSLGDETLFGRLRDGAATAR